MNMVTKNLKMTTKKDEEVDERDDEEVDEWDDVKDERDDQDERDNEENDADDENERKLDNGNEHCDDKVVCWKKKFKSFISAIKTNIDDFQVTDAQVLAPFRRFFHTKS